MGDRQSDHSPSAWQRSLGEMRDHGTILAATCTARGCGHWQPLDVLALIERFGEAWSPWNRQPRCTRCGHKGHYMASPGRGTPMRPLRAGLAATEARRAFIAGFGFSARDVVRIRAMAESATATWTPLPLNDLDVPFVIGVEGPAGLNGAKILGEWEGRTLTYRAMNPAERACWAARPPGPRKV